MKRPKIIKKTLLFLVVGILSAAAISYFIINEPHRDIQSIPSDYQLSSSQIVSEYLANPTLANQKYLDSEGESKVLEIRGTVSAISEDFNKQKVILLQSAADSAGVSCTFLPENNNQISQIKIGEPLLVKGVIRSGASYDSDLGMFENVILEKCTLIFK